MVRLLQTAFTTLLVLGFFTAAFSQPGTDNDAIDANAEVQAYIDVTTGDNIDYGTLTTGDDDGSNSPTQAGNFTVSGTNGAGIDLSFGKTDLSHESSGSGDRTIIINMDEADNGAWADTKSSDFASASNKFNLNTGTNSTLPSDGDITVWTNPTITLDGNEVPGTYSGSVTLTATYN